MSFSQHPLRPRLAKPMLKLAETCVTHEGEWEGGGVTCRSVAKAAAMALFRLILLYSPSLRMNAVL